MQTILWVIAMVAAVAAPGSSRAFDHHYDKYAAFLEGAVSPAGVDYSMLAGRRAQLEEVLGDIRTANAAQFTAQQQLALYVNAYNAATLATVLDEMPLRSIRELNGGQVWKRRQFMVAGRWLTLDEIEHERVRPLSDGRVHAVVNCASRGCPPLPATPLRAEGIESQLDAATRMWVESNAYVLEGDRVRLHRIFDWYREDFAHEVKGDVRGVAGGREAALWFIARFCNVELASRLTSGDLTVSWNAYDWSLNDQ